MYEEVSWKKRILMVGVGLGFATFLLWYINFYVFNSRAGQLTISTTWAPSSVSVGGAPTSTDLALTSPTGIGGFDIRFTTTGPVTVVGTATPTSLDTAEAFTPVISEGNRSSYVLISAQAGTLPKTITLPVTLSCTEEGSGTVTIDTSTSEGIGSGTDKLSVTSKELQVTCASGSIQALDEALPTGYATYFDPVLVRAAVGQEFTYSYVVQADPNDFIAGFAAKLKFDPSLVEVISVGGLVREGAQTSSGSGTITPATQKPVADGTAGTTQNGGVAPATDVNPLDIMGIAGDPGVQEVLKKIDNIAGTLDLTYVVVQQDEQLPAKISIPIKLKAKKDGTGTIDFTSFESKLKSNSTVQPTKKAGTYIIGAGSATVTPPGGGTVTPPAGGTVTPPTGGGGTGNIILNIRTRLQGVVATPATRTVIPIRVGIGGAALAEPVYTSAQFTFQNDLTWTGTARLEAPAGEGYVIYLKGPNHLQKKLCDVTPVDPSGEEFYACDTGDIALVDGANSFDFSGVRLLAGDNPDQDGVVNSYDINVCRTSLGKSDTDSLRLCDLNLDGKVNALDHSLVIANLAIKTDDPTE